MTASGDKRDETVEAGAIDPGPLSRLLQELADASVASHLLGRDRESKDALGVLEREHPEELIMIACARAWRGDLDGGFVALDIAAQAKDQRLWPLRAYPHLRPLHSEPRFPALLRRLEFPEEGKSGQPPAP